LYNWIEQHAWQPFEHWEGQEIFDEIDNLANSMNEYVGVRK